MIEYLDTKNERTDYEKVTARCVRLNIIEATDVPTIWEVGLYNAENQSEKEGR